MALRKILSDDDPGLMKKSRVITDFNKRLHVLLDDLRETLIDANGLGLAAPQVGVLRRAALVVETTSNPTQETIAEAAKVKTESEFITEQKSESESKFEHESDSESDTEPDSIDDKIVELINPEILYKDGEQSDKEGCLSVPGIFGIVTCPQTLKIKAQDRYGIPFEMDATDMTARAICHEINHLDGILFTSIADRILTDEELEEMNNTQDKTKNKQEEQ